MTLIVAALAVLRISYMLVAEEGPFLIFVRWRKRIGVRYDEHSQQYATNEFAKLFTCVYCLSLWVSLVFVIAYWLVPDVVFWVSLPFAMSGFAIILEKHL